MSSPHGDEGSYEFTTRKRVGKACDRCRLKKSKCDGQNPCSRCKADNAICVFGERKKSHDKVVPRGYVDMLEQQQNQIVAGLREMYRILRENGTWPGEALPEYEGNPLTHDILSRLRVLHMTGTDSEETERFEDNLNTLHKKLMKKNGISNPRHRRSTSEESEPGLAHSPHSISSAETPSISNSSGSGFSRKRSNPPTPILEDIPELQYPSKRTHYAVTMPELFQASPMDPLVVGGTENFESSLYSSDLAGSLNAESNDFTAMSLNAPTQSSNISYPDADWFSFVSSAPDFHMTYRTAQNGRY